MKHKVCKMCKQNKLLKEFAKTRGTYLNSHCRQCYNIRRKATDKRYIKKVYSIKSKWLKFIKRTKRYRKFYFKKYPKRQIASSRLSHAIASGKIIRQSCEICGAKFTHAHHDDYNYPLKVRWLCPTHHKEAHRKKKIY